MLNDSENETAGVCELKPPINDCGTGNNVTRADDLLAEPTVRANKVDSSTKTAMLGSFKNLSTIGKSV